MIRALREGGGQLGPRGDVGENLAMARFEPPAEMLRRRAAVRGDQAATNRLFLMREGGTIPVDAAEPAAPAP